jgi:hypothetical protein
LLDALVDIDASLLKLRVKFLDTVNCSDSPLAIRQRSIEYADVPKSQA